MIFQGISIVMGVSKKMDGLLLGKMPLKWMVTAGTPMTHETHHGKGWDFGCEEVLHEAGGFPVVLWHKDRHFIC